MVRKFIIGADQLKNQIEVRICDALASGTPMRRKHLLRLASSTRESASFDNAIRRLIKHRLIQRMRYGVYLLAGVPVPTAEAIPPMEAAFKRPTEDKILRLLTSAKTPMEIRKKTDVSRQRVHQILNRLELAQKITREMTAIEGQYQYVVAPNKRETRRN